MAIKEKSTNYQKAQKYAFWLLARRNHSEKEIREKIGRNYDENVVEKVIEKLKILKLINDEKFAKEWTEYRLRNNKSKNFILRELNRKGITHEMAATILNSFSIDETEVAYKIIRNKLPRYKKLEPLKAKNKIYQFLTRKGFDYDTIEQVVNRLGKENSDETD
ncbi:MAG: regulatory protein RecX [Elusimicrobiota bacterium]